MYLHIDYGFKNLWYTPIPWNETSIFDPQVYSLRFDDWSFFVTKRIPRFPKEMKADLVCVLR
jgi:hypothetical protein